MTNPSDIENQRKSHQWLQGIVTSLLKGYRPLDLKTIPNQLISTRPEKKNENEIKPASTAPGVQSFNYYQLDSDLQRHFLAAQGNLVHIEGTDEYVHLLDTRDTSKGASLPKYAFLIEAIKYFRGALILIEYNHLIEKSKLNAILIQLLEEYEALFKKVNLTQQELTQQDLTQQEVIQFHNKICNLLKVSKKQLALARDLALQRLKPIPRITLHQKKNQVFIHATIPSPNTNAIVGEKNTRVDPTARKGLTGLSEKDKSWVKNFYNDNEKEIEENGCYASPSMAALTCPRNTLSETTCAYEIDEKKGIVPDSLRKAHIERMGLASPFKHSYFWSKDREIRIQSGVKILLTKIKSKLTEQILEHFEKYGDLYRKNDTIEFPIVYSTALSPTLLFSVATELSVLEDNNHFFLQEKEEIIRRVQQQINNNPSCVIVTESNKVENSLSQSSLIPCDFKVNKSETISPDDKQQRNSSEKVTIDENQQLSCKNVKIKLKIKDINNPLNEWKAVSYTRNEDVSQSNDLIYRLGDDLKRFIVRAQKVEVPKPDVSKSDVPKPDVSKSEVRSINDKVNEPTGIQNLTNDEIKALYQLQYALSSPNVSFFGQKFGKADLINRPWNEETLKEILAKLRAGKIKLSSGNLSHEAQRELANRIEAAIHLRDINHESILMRASRGLVKAIKKGFDVLQGIPFWGGMLTSIGGAVAGVVDMVLNTWTAKLCSPATSLIHASHEAKGYNIKLLKSAYEVLTVGSKGMVIGFCKSSDDRTTVIMTAIDAMISNPELLKLDIGDTLYNKLFAEMKELIDTGMYSHATSQHSYAIKFKDVGSTYVEKCVPQEMQERLLQLKIFRKTLENKYTKIKPTQVAPSNNGEQSNSSKDLSEVIESVNKSFQEHVKPQNAQQTSSQSLSPIPTINNKNTPTNTSQFLSTHAKVLSDVLPVVPTQQEGQVSSPVTTPEDAAPLLPQDKKSDLQPGASTARKCVHIY